MNNLLNNQPHIQVAFQLFIIAVALIGGAWIADHNQATAVSKITILLEREEIYLSELEDIIDRNGADEVIASTIDDCSRRAEHESLLSKLGTLTKKELLTLQTLFESCGSFYSERKSLMVAKLKREVEWFNALHTLLSTFDSRRTDQFRLAEWIEIVEREENRALLMKELEAIQGNIISSLISGSSPNSKDVTDLVEHANQVNVVLKIEDQEIDRLRESIKK